jgi:hypothetical protein
MNLFTRDITTVTTRISWWAVLIIVLSGLYPALRSDAYWAVPLTMGVVSAAFAGWKCVQLLGHILVQVQGADSEVDA